MSNFVLPGDLVTTDAGLLRGHGSYIEESSSEGQQLISSVAGEIERVNKLISVKPLKSRYFGEVGDLVVGRISAVDSKRWKVDICGPKDAMLDLSSVNLPGGAQRIRTYEDQLQMRSLFTEYDLISAEVQRVSTEGVVSLHTRSLKYGKLENGQLIIVPQCLIRRLPQHYVSLPWGIDLVMGKNGYIWITRTIPEEWKSADDMDEDVPLAETLQYLKKRHAETTLLADDRLKIARVRNSIYALSQTYIPISPESISYIYQRSIELDLHPKDMVQPKYIIQLTSALLPNN